MDECDSLSKQYEQCFEPLEYLEFSMSSFGANLSDKDIYTWIIDGFHDIFQTGMVKGSRLLDIGTGPNISSVISATPHCRSIILSEFTPKSRDFLKLWLDGRSPYDFSHIFKYILDKEGQGELIGDRESQLREKITAIMPVDLLKDHPFSPCYLSKFPIITSSLCLQDASTDYAEYKKIAAHVASLLETGGHLVSTGSLNQPFYLSEGVEYALCSLSAQQVKDAWTECGLKIVVWKEGKPKRIKREGHSHLFIMCAKKLSD